MLSNTNKLIISPDLAVSAFLQSWHTRPQRCRHSPRLPDRLCWSRVPERHSSLRSLSCLASLVVICATSAVVSGPRCRVSIWTAAALTFLLHSVHDCSRRIESLRILHFSHERATNPSCSNWYPALEIPLRTCTKTCCLEDMCGVLAVFWHHGLADLGDRPHILLAAGAGLEWTRSWRNEEPGPRSTAVWSMDSASGKYSSGYPLFVIARQWVGHKDGQLWSIYVFLLCTWK